MSIRFPYAIGLTCAIVFAHSDLVRAQNTNDFNAGIQFDFGGARSLAMGGAFVAIADDATTVYGNPAGLTTFTRMEVSGEFRLRNWATTVAHNGHAFGAPSGIGVDTIADVGLRTFHVHNHGPAFTSFVYPKGNWGFGVFARAQARYRMNRQTEGTFFNCSGGYRGDPVVRAPFCEPHSRQDGIDRLFPSKQTVALDVTGVGGGIGYRFARPSLAIGGGVHRASLSIEGQQTVFSVRDAKKFQPANLTDPGNIELTSVQSGDDAAWSYSLGLMWTSSDYLSVGGSYQYGPTFRFRTTTILGPTNPRPGFILVPASDDVFNIPDQLTAGASYRPNPNASNYLLLFSAQYELVRYTDLLDQFHEVLAPENDPESLVVLDRLHIDDANGFRAGTELSITALKGRMPVAIALRGGTAYFPAHETSFRTDDPATGFPDPRLALLFPEGKSQWHASFGAGVAVGRVQFDVGADLANAGNTFALSAVLRF